MVEYVSYSTLTYEKRRRLSKKEKPNPKGQETKATRIAGMVVGSVDGGLVVGGLEVFGLGKYQH